MNQQNCSTATALSSCQASVLEQAMKLSQENTLTTGNVYFSFLYAGIFFFFFFFFNTKIICHLRFLAWFQVLVFKLFSFLKKRERQIISHLAVIHLVCFGSEGRKMYNAISARSVVCILFELSHHLWEVCVCV